MNAVRGQRIGLLMYDVCLPTRCVEQYIFLHFLKTHAGSAKAAIGKSGLTNTKLHNLQICISLVPMPLPDFISRPGSEARYAYQKMESSFYHLQML